MVLRTGAFVLSLLLGVVFLLPSLSHAQAFKCADGTMSHPATEAEAVYAAGGDITVGVTQVCSVFQAGITEEAGRAKQYLKSVAIQRAASAAWRITDLNDKFAVCAAQFLRFANDNQKNARITDAVRTYDEQQSACNRARATGGVANCNMDSAEHPKGVAIDATSNDERWMFANAPQFGLVYYLGSYDSVHFVPLNASSFGRLQASASRPERNITPQIIATAQQNLQKGSDCASPGFQPQNVGVARAAAPFGLGDLARASLYGGQPYGMSPFGMQPQLPPQPLPQQQPLMNSFAPQPLPQPAVAPTTQTQQQPQTQTNSNTNTNTNSSANVDLSIADRLRQLMDGTPTPTPGSSATTVPIIITGASAGTIASSGDNQPEQQSTTSTGSLQPVGQQTFTSQDLRWEPQQPAASSFDGSTYSRLVQLYTSLRDTLAKILEYLRPFGGGRAPVVHE